MSGMKLGACKSVARMRPQGVTEDRSINIGNPEPRGMLLSHYVVHTSTIFAGDNSDSDAGSESDEPLTPAEIRMNEAMGPLDDIVMDMRLLQVWSVCGGEGAFTKG